MWWGWDECQGSEGVNKTPRQSEGRCVARVLHLSQQTYIPFVMKEAMSWVGWWNFNIQWCRGGLRVAEKVSKVSKRNQYPLTTNYGWVRNRMMRGFPLQPDECLARYSHGIQPNSEEKEIVCQVWSPDTVEGRSPDTILLLQPNGMVEIVGSIPSCISFN